MSAKDEARQKLEDYLRIHIKPCSVNIELKRDHLTECLDDGMEYADAYAAHAVAEARAPLGDSQLLTLFRQWSEDHYCASFMSPSPDTVSRFLDSLEPHNLPAQLEDYETQFLDEVRSQLAQRETVAALAAKETGDE